MIHEIKQPGELFTLERAEEIKLIAKIADRKGLQLQADAIFQLSLFIRQALTKASAIFADVVEVIKMIELSESKDLPENATLEMRFEKAMPITGFKEGEGKR